MHKNYNEEIRIKIKKVMAEEKLNQIEVCRKTGIDKGTFSKFIRGKSDLAMMNYKRLSTYLEAYDDVVVTDEEEKNAYLHIVEEEKPCKSYEDMTLDEVYDLAHQVTEIARNKIRAKLDEIECEISKSYEEQEKYEKLLKEL